MLIVVHFIRMTMCYCRVVSPIKKIPFLEALQKVRAKKLKKGRLEQWIDFCLQRKADRNKVIGAFGEELEDEDAKQSLLVAQNDKLKFGDNDLESHVVSQDQRLQLKNFKNKLTEELHLLDRDI